MHKCTGQTPGVGPHPGQAWLQGPEVQSREHEPKTPFPLPLRTSLSCRCLSLPISHTTHTTHPVLAHMAIRHQSAHTTPQEQTGRESDAISCPSLIQATLVRGPVPRIQMTALVPRPVGPWEGMQCFSLEGNMG